MSPRCARRGVTDFESFSAGVTTLTRAVSTLLARRSIGVPAGTGASGIGGGVGGRMSGSGAVTVTLRAVPTSRARARIVTAAFALAGSAPTLHATSLPLCPQVPRSLTTASTGVASGPALCTVSVYVNADPATTRRAEAVFVTDRSYRGGGSGGGGQATTTTAPGAWSVGRRFQVSM